MEGSRQTGQAVQRNNRGWVADISPGIHAMPKPSLDDWNPEQKVSLPIKGRSDPKTNLRGQQTWQKSQIYHSDWQQ